jgi:putative transposase
MGGAGVMDEKMRQEIALHRWAVIAEAANPRLTSSERGSVVRAIAARQHAHPDGTVRRYSRGTIDRWLRAWRAGGAAALRPSPRSDTGKVRAMPELFGEAAALRLELPGRSAAQIASILYHRHGVRVAERTISGQLRRAGLHRAALKAAPKAYGRYEAERPNERWVTDVLVGPWVPYPKRDGSARARLFLIVDDHSRLLVDGRFYDRENARICQELLRRAITRRGIPDILYALVLATPGSPGICPAACGNDTLRRSLTFQASATIVRRHLVIKGDAEVCGGRQGSSRSRIGGVAATGRAA